MAAIWAILIVFLAGCIGGLSNAIISGNLHLPHKVAEADIYSPGWVGNVLVGGIAAIVFWGLYGPFSDSMLLGMGETPSFTLTIAEVAGSLVTGVGGGRILTSQIDKQSFTNARNSFQESIDTAIKITPPLQIKRN